MKKLRLIFHNVEKNNNKKLYKEFFEFARSIHLTRWSDCDFERTFVGKVIFRSQKQLFFFLNKNQSEFLFYLL